MQKKFYVSGGPDGSAPGFDRFSRINELNMLISQGWRIMEFVREDDKEFFIIEKTV
ncbi:MAG: hypothetical protein IKN17_08890 [Ruminococcus sp.]|nr:hypothetical protein [Ruminococcus sp.]